MAKPKRDLTYLLEKSNNSLKQDTAKWILKVSELIGKGYDDALFFNNSARYRGFKGSRNSKKSYVILGFEVILKILSDPLRNALFVRKVFKSNRNSTFAVLQRLIEKPDAKKPEITLRDYFRVNKTDMTITYLPTGQSIFFAGFDDPLKLTSFQTKVGHLTDIYIEEAFEIKDEDAFDKLDGSLRAKLPDGTFLQITFAFNAWNDGHWLKKRFFDGRLDDDYNYLINHDYADYYDKDYIGNYGKGLYLHTSTYKINEFRDTKNYDIAMETLREKAPELYRVVALGMWGNSLGAAYPEFSEDNVVTIQHALKQDFRMTAIGIDTGLSNGEGKIKKNKDGKERVRSATTMVLSALTNDGTLYAGINEYFHTNAGMEIPKKETEIMIEIVKKIKEWRSIYWEHQTLLKGAILCFVDNADVGFRQGLDLYAKKENLYGVTFLPSTKLPIHQRVMFSRTQQALGKFLVTNLCKNLIREIKNSKKAEDGGPREDYDDHTINASEYGWAPFSPYMRIGKSG